MSKHRYRRRSHSSRNPNTDRARGPIEATLEQREQLRELIVLKQKNHHEAARIVGLPVSTVRQIIMTFRTPRTKPETDVLNGSTATCALYKNDKRPDEAGMNQVLLRVWAEAQLARSAGLVSDA